MAIAIKSGNFTPCPEGEHNAVCVDVVDLGMVTTKGTWGEKTQPKVLVTWQTETLDEKGLPYLIFKRYTASMHEKSVLFLDTKRWFRADFPQMVPKIKKDVECLIGKTCRIDIIHNDQYANVDSIKPIQAGTKAPEVHPDFIRKKDRVDGVGPFGKRGQSSNPDDHNEEAEDF